jgi:hypothetical protein
VLVGIAVALIGGSIQDAITKQTSKSAETVTGLTTESQKAIAAVEAASQEAVAKMTTASQEGVAKITVASQEAIAQKTMTKEYVQAAVNVLSQPYTRESVPLRTWAAEVLSGESPTSVSSMDRQSLIHPTSP